MTEKTENILRWIAVPFVPFVGYLIAYYIVWLFCFINGFSANVQVGESSFINNIIYTISLLLRDGVGGLAFVLSGFLIAPSHKHLVALILTIVGIGLMIYSAFTSFFVEMDSILPYWVSVVVTSIGCIAACIWTFGEEE